MEINLIELAKNDSLKRMIEETLDSVNNLKKELKVSEFQLEKLKLAKKISKDIDNFPVGTELLISGKKFIVRAHRINYEGELVFIVNNDHQILNLKIDDLVKFVTPLIY